jgi:hypothetical protein
MVHTVITILLSSSELLLNDFQEDLMTAMFFLFGNRKVVSKYKGNGKDAPVHAMKAYRESKGTALLMLNLSARWR